MRKNEESLSEMIKMRDSIIAGDYDHETAKHLLNDLNRFSMKSENKNIFKKTNIIKSFLVTFNISNFSELTVLFFSNDAEIKIIEFAGNKTLYNDIKKIIEADEILNLNTENYVNNDLRYRLFYESMNNSRGKYTILTITESRFFKPSKFHMLSDIIMDIIRSTDISRDSVFNDLFENNIIDINKHIAENEISNSEFLLFQFENLNDFFTKMGFKIIIEISDTIIKKLKNFFGDKSSVFRISFSEYIIIIEGKNDYDRASSDEKKYKTIDFNYKGIVLNYRFIKIPYANNQSIYDIFEKISYKKNSQIDYS